MSNPCAICLEAITLETGMTTLACSHSFHFRCIATWIIKDESCPCCRGKLGDLEKLPEEVHIDVEHDETVFGDDDETVFGDDDEDYSDHVAIEIEREISPAENWVKINGQWVAGVQIQINN